MNAANYGNTADWNNLDGNVTTVGTNGAPSFYGTYDQTGNVTQWNDLADTTSSIRGLRGGYWGIIGNSLSLLSSSIRTGIYPSYESRGVGFRLASYSNPLSLPNFVTVRDINNLNDVPNGHGNSYGRVEHVYQIGSLLVTNAEYVLFLKAVASTDTSGLYSTSMAGDRGGITRSGAVGSYDYETKTNYADKPVIWVSWFDCARYCNWLHNDKGSGSTETGAYNLSGAAADQAPAKTVGAKYWIPTENEWYKAAYYAAVGGGSYKYWTYATQSDTIPNTIIADDVGNGPSPAAARTPVFVNTTATADGFTMQISNYDSFYTWAGTVTMGTVAISGTGFVTVTGVNAARFVTATITTTRTGYLSGSAQAIVFTLNTARTPTFGTPTATSTGFTVQISNYSGSYTWAGTATASGTVVVSGSGLVTVTNVAPGTSSTATITTTRSGWATGTATVTETSL